MKRVIAITSFLLTLIPLASTAVTYRGQTIYRSTAPNTVYLTGTPGEIVPMIAGKTITTKAILADACGVVSYKNKNILHLTKAEANGVDANTEFVWNRPVADYKCVAGVPSNIPATGETWINNDSKYFRMKGFEPGTLVNLIVEIPRVWNVKLNACGLGKVKESEKMILSDSFVKFNGRSYDFENELQTITNAPVCRKVGGIDKTYVPTDWLF